MSFMIEHIQINTINPSYQSMVLLFLVSISLLVLMQWEDKRKRVEEREE